MTTNEACNKTRKGDAELIIALATGASVTEAAKRAGVSNSTVFRRLQEPDFRAAIQNTRSVLVAETIGKLVEAGSEAVTTLRKLLKHKSGYVQLGAAKAILETMPKLRESEELAERILRLEEQLSANREPEAKRWQA